MEYTAYISLPGGCNAHCDFCCWSRKKEPLDRDEYRFGLAKILLDRRAYFKSINILGGEPLLSSHIGDVLDLFTYIRRFMPKTVITTNGTGFPKYAHRIGMAINHVNLSRHAITDEENTLVFGKKAFLPKADILECANTLAEYGVDLSINCVLHNKTPIKTKRDVLDFAKFCYDNGAVATCFKKLEGPDISPAPQQQLFSDVTIASHTECDVCRTDTQLLDGMVVHWQAASGQLSKTEKLFIIQPDLSCTSDWAGKQRIL